MPAIEYRDAIAEWRKVSQQQLERGFDPLKAKDYYRTVHDLSHLEHISHCDFCGFPIGERGYLRFNWPLGHPYFGKAVKCPRCNK